MRRLTLSSSVVCSGVCLRPSVMVTQQRAGAAPTFLAPKACGRSGQHSRIRSSTSFCVPNYKNNHSYIADFAADGKLYLLTTGACGVCKIWVSPVSCAVRRMVVPMLVIGRST